MTPTDEAREWMEKIDAASEELTRLCDGTWNGGVTPWRWSIPAEDGDTDIVIADGLRAGRDAIAALDRARQQGREEERARINESPDGYKLLLRLDVAPVTKPRMTRADRRLPHRPAVGRYFAFQDEVQLKARGWKPPASNGWIIFTVPMPKSWPKKKRAAMNGRPHQQTPDKDNLEKAFLDCFGEDRHIWDGRVSKVWGETGTIIVYQCDELANVRKLSLDASA